MDVVVKKVVSNFVANGETCGSIYAKTVDRTEVGAWDAQGGYAGLLEFKSEFLHKEGNMHNSEKT